ncbi:hypothetical protein [uncultured Helicobacter sp.]|uniref:hypothetical protein n=1 Tax=uncultured Helicobacter sp. TaxID=175537 RepID=UPI0037538BDD
MKKQTEIKTLTRKIVKLLENQQDSYHYNYYMGTLRYIIKNLEQEKAKKPAYNKKTQRR